MTVTASYQSEEAFKEVSWSSKGLVDYGKLSLFLSSTIREEMRLKVRVRITVRFTEGKV